MKERAIRTRIDVGDTHAKTVTIDSSTNRIVGKGSVMTTHFAKEGMAKRVMDPFRECLGENNIQSDEVIFITRSAIQATDALLEGDVTKIGVIGIGKGGLESFFTRHQTKIPDIDLGTGEFIHIDSHFIKAKDMNENSVQILIQDVYNQGDRIIVASKTFGVNNMSEEKLVPETADKMGLPSSMASDITKLYGLTTRTRTAAPGASILPKIMETVSSTESSVYSTDVNVPLTITRGDGGVMEANEMKKRPAPTMLSDPATSVIGALMYLRASNGIYFGVGGTSTNIGVIKNGRPAIDYAIISGHQTYINSLDIRVLGVAGGSMVRVGKNGITGVGPRSVHIANMDYACFTDPSLLEGATLYHIRSRENDPGDCVAICLNNRESVTITNTCAANVLGTLAKGDYARGNEDSARTAIKLLADKVGMSVEGTARAILQKPTGKIKPVIENLIVKYKIERDQIVLVGAGGGADTLLTFTANDIGFKYQTPESTKIIFSIGVALAMVREMVERTLSNPSTQDIAQLKEEAKEMAMDSGTVENGIEVYVEIDEQAQKVTAIAMGSIEVETTDLIKNCDGEEAVNVTAASMGVTGDKVNLEATNRQIFVATYRQGNRNQPRVIDKRGFVRIQHSDGSCLTTTMEKSGENLKKIWDAPSNFSSEIRISPGVYVICGPRVIDYSGIPEYKQVAGLIGAELSDRAPSDEIMLVLAKNALGWSRTPIVTRRRTTDNYPDEYWYGLLLSKDSAARPLTSMQKSIIIKQSMQKAALQREHIRKCLGDQPPESCLGRMGFDLKNDGREPMVVFLCMGLIGPNSKTVWTNIALISMVEHYIEVRMPEDISRRQKLREIVYWHEFYHVIEEYTPDIYTRNVRVPSRFLGMIPCCRKVEVASEIGAIHFSKLISNMAFSPYIYIKYLMAAANQDLEVRCGH